VIAFLADEDFDNDIVRGVLLRLSDLDMVCVQDVSLLGESDPVVLEWAAREKRVLLTHDIRTMRRYAYLRLEAGLSMPAVFMVPQSLPVGQAIDEVLLLAECSLEMSGKGKYDSCHYSSVSRMQRPASRRRSHYYRASTMELGILSSQSKEWGSACRV
jgi:hypothetical protein